jgi:transcriptional regulator GlxA family with amidase domain
VKVLLENATRRAASGVAKAAVERHGTDHAQPSRPETTVVRRRIGRTVQEWIIVRRMSEARVLLGGTDLPISEIARRVGVADAGYFARLFRTIHGVSPRRWRPRRA